MTDIALALFLATANYAVVNYLVDPIRQRFPDLDLWWVVYVSFITGGLLAWFAGVDLFSEAINNEVMSRLVTAAVIGGGSNLINAVFGNR